MSPVDNKPPVVVNKGFKVVENGITFVTNEVLDVNDKDTDDQELLFTLVSNPKHGSLKYDSVQIPLG